MRRLELGAHPNQPMQGEHLFLEERKDKRYGIQNLIKVQKNEKIFSTEESLFKTLLFRHSIQEKS